MPLTILNVSYPLAKVSSDTAGGAEQVLATIDEELVRQRHSSLVIAPAGSRISGTLISPASTTGILDERAQQLARMRHRETINRVLNEHAVDVIHLHGIDFAEYLPDTDIPVIVTLHLPLSWYPHDVLRPRGSMSFVYVSRNQANTRLATAETSLVIENGVPRPHPAPRRHSQARPFVLSMGRICPEKGFHHAMDAATRCGIRFLLAGEVYDYPAHREYFEREIQPRLDREHRFIGTLARRRRYQLLADATCVLIPSLAPETSSLVAMEALACGTPVVAFRAGALCEIVDHGRTGFLVDSVEEMADGISKAATIDRGECRREAEARFSADRMVESYLALYHRVARSWAGERVALAH